MLVLSDAVVRFSGFLYQFAGDGGAAAVAVAVAVGGVVAVG